MASAALRLPTFEEMYRQIEALPEGMTGEILGPGVVRAMSRPGAPHTLAARRVGRGLRGVDQFEGGLGWWIEIEREIHFPDDRLFVPDLAGWQAENPDFLDENPILVVPDWACEILSRSTQRADRVLKLPFYANNGVGHVWVVDPAAQTVEVYDCRDGTPRMVATAAGNEEAELPPFPGPMAVGDLWRRRLNPPGG